MILNYKFRDPLMFTIQVYNFPLASSDENYYQSLSTASTFYANIKHAQVTGIFCYVQNKQGRIKISRKWRVKGGLSDWQILEVKISRRG